MTKSITVREVTTTTLNDDHTVVCVPKPSK